MAGLRSPQPEQKVGPDQAHVLAQLATWSADAPSPHRLDAEATGRGVERVSAIATSPARGQRHPSLSLQLHSVEGHRHHAVNTCDAASHADHRHSGGEGHQWAVRAH
jgi:hypothetical protein